MAVSLPNLVILGPTASGKSALAIPLAQSAGAEILSVDSMQVYRGMDIGTAKPTPQQRRRIGHHLIDVVNPDEAFTVARFVQAADEVMADAARREVPLILTGGTPLYYKALFEGLFEGPSADPVLRARLASLDNSQLAAQLKQIDPIAAGRIHVNDTKRLIRAIEVHELTGRPISSLQDEWGGMHRHRALWIGLQWDRDALNRSINLRVKQMLASGWVDETRQLLQSTGPISHTAAEATGYRELIQHVQGNMSLDDAAEQIKIATRQLARRQMKWFRRFENVTWINGQRPFDELMEISRMLWFNNSASPSRGGLNRMRPSARLAGL